MTRHVLSLAHSPDPDDAFMWWPITGKVRPDGAPIPGVSGQPVIDTGRFSYRAIPADIEQLNIRAATAGDLDVTALSARAFASVCDRYAITACGGSFGEGYGPKIVAPAHARLVGQDALKPDSLRIAIPGRRTTAFLVLCLALGLDAAAAASPRFVEMPFDRIINAVARGEVEAGLVIHEGQLMFQDAGLALVLDLGVWWQSTRGLPLPLGVNAVRRDLDARFGPGSFADVISTLNRSVAYAAEHRDESLQYALTFALANEAKGAGGTPTLERVSRYIDLYVTQLTLDMGDAGRGAITRLFADGAAAGLCPAVRSIEAIRTSS